MAQDLVTRMAARDATASTLLVSSDSLRDVAVQMGVADMPGSVTVSVKDVKTVAEASPSAAKAQAGDQPVTITYTLSWSGSKAATGHVAQTLTAVARKDGAGKTHLVDIAVSGPIVFDMTGYFGTTGTSEADAKKVADDLTAGTKWIPEVTVAVTTSDAELTLDDVIVPDPHHLTTWTKTVSTAVPGNQRTWNVDVSTSGGTSYAGVHAATAQTVAPVAAQVAKGSLTSSDALAQGNAVLQKFGADAGALNVDAANGLLVPDEPKVSKTGLAMMLTMKTSTITTTLSVASEGNDGPEVWNGAFVVVMQPDGSWLIDSSRSDLPVSLDATSDPTSYWKLTAKGNSGCSGQLTMYFEGVIFYTSGSADAVFDLTSNGCALHDTFIALTVTWPGNPTPVKESPGLDGSDPSTTSVVIRYVRLPVSVTATKHPITIVLTNYGDPSSGSWDPMTFTTK
jgi:hypothetical protein